LTIDPSELILGDLLHVLTAVIGTSLPTLGNATSSSAIQGSTDADMSHPVRYPEAIKVAFVRRMRLLEPSVNK
jgi:hypothetical protein